MAKARKAARKRPSAKKAGRKSAKKAVKKSAKKAKKAVKKVAKKVSRAAKRASARKSVRKAVKKVRKAAKKAKKVVRKAAPPPPPPQNPVSWFEIPTRDIYRAQSFYEAVLGTKMTMQPDMGGFRMCWFNGHMNGQGASGTLMQSEGYNPGSSGSLVYFEVADIDACLNRAAANGGQIINPKMAIGEYGFVGHFHDPEGNRIGLHSMK